MIEKSRQRYLYLLVALASFIITTPGTLAEETTSSDKTTLLTVIAANVSNDETTIIGGSDPNTTTHKEEAVSNIQQEAHQGGGQDVNWDFFSWQPCGKTSVEFLEELTPEDDVHPCIMYDINPSSTSNNTDDPPSSYVVTLVQVTSAASTCASMRDGAVISVELLNGENDGRGISVGFNKDVFIQFRLVSLVAGHSAYINFGDNYTYLDRHAQVLDVALTELKPQYIIGTCSFLSRAEDQVAWDHNTMLLAQVGPPSYYETGNPYLFGMHMNSDLYPLPAARALGFAVQEQYGPTGFQQQPVRVLYRSQSEFFYSTCRSAIDNLKEQGFTDVLELLFDPFADHDGDGIENYQDVDFLEDLADQACSVDEGTTHHNDTPAIFACLHFEQDVILPRLLQNGCRPNLLWLTAATWTWAERNQETIPFFQGGGQWHKALRHSDQFFESGIELLKWGKTIYGYQAAYDFVVSYSIPMLFAEHLKAVYRVTNNPDPAPDFGTKEGYELMRRGMIILSIETLFGPVQFDENQRNIGRAAAGTQWLPAGPQAAAPGTYENRLVSPGAHAEEAIEVPAPSARDCPPGEFIDASFAINGTSLLYSRCSECPENTITWEPNQLHQCIPCPEGSSTQGRTGETQCTFEDENLIPDIVLAFGYTMVSITWALGLLFMVWLNQHRRDAVVQIAQYPFMMLICVGAVISSSTIIALSRQAGTYEDTTAATTACRVAPFLYTIGWVLQYGSLTAKTFRMHKIVNNRNFERKVVTAFQTSWIVALVLSMDMIFVITWTVVAPMEYRRETTSVAISGEEHIEIIYSHGQCSAPEGSSIWAFAGPIAGIHLVLIMVTNYMLFKIRDIEERYQEQKYVALASMFVFEVLVIGVPVLHSVGDNTEAIFLVLSSIIALNDVGILGFVFVPKVYFQRRGLTPGVGVGESLMKSTHKKAQMRESNFSVVSRNSMQSAVSDPMLSLGSVASIQGLVQSREEVMYSLMVEKCEQLARENEELKRLIENSQEVDQSPSIGISASRAHQGVIPDTSCEEEVERQQPEAHSTRSEWNSKQEGKAEIDGKVAEPNNEGSDVQVGRAP